MTDKNNQCSVQSLHWSKRPSPKMTLLGNLPPILKRRILQTPSDQATQVESTTRPSAFSVHKALPSRSLHSPASRDAQVGDVCLRFAWNLRRLNATIWCIVNNINNKQQNNYSRIALESSHLQMSGTRSICGFRNRVATLQCRRANPTGPKDSSTKLLGVQLHQVFHEKNI